MGRLTTHVLDTAKGRPAQNLTIELFKLTETERQLVKTVATNDDGRVDGPILEGDALTPGLYELVFHAGAYLGTEQNGFLTTIPIRFGIHNASEHYHVPLLLSPFGYTTYRGS